MSNVDGKGKSEGGRIDGGRAEVPVNLAPAQQGLVQPRVDGMGAIGVEGKPITPQGLRYGDYKRHNLGYPVQPGQNWHDLTAAQRQHWFRNHEQRWKSRMNEKQQGANGMQPSLTFGQG